MNNIFLILLTGSLLLISCQASRKNSETNLSVQNAIWYNWSGGQPGIGGTNYEVYISASGEDVIFQNLILDGKDIGIEKIEKKENIYTVYATEDKSAKREDVVGGSRPNRPDFRLESPKQATLKGIINNQPFEVDIKNFEKQPAKNLP